MFTKDFFKWTQSKLQRKSQSGSSSTNYKVRRCSVDQNQKWNKFRISYIRKPFFRGIWSKKNVSRWGVKALWKKCKIVLLAPKSTQMKKRNWNLSIAQLAIKLNKVLKQSTDWWAMQKKNVRNSKSLWKVKGAKS